jgi:hypothetical protein
LNKRSLERGGGGGIRTLEGRNEPLSIFETVPKVPICRDFSGGAPVCAPASGAYAPTASRTYRQAVGAVSAWKGRRRQVRTPLRRRNSRDPRSAIVTLAGRRPL